jgi:hypothetical protein
MALVAVVKRAGDRPGELPETQVVPVGMPQDVAFNAYFGQPAVAGGGFTKMFAAAGPGLLQSRRLMPPSTKAAAGRFRDMFAQHAKQAEFTEVMAPLALPLAPPAQSQQAEDTLLDLAARMEPDGGMPGATIVERVNNTIAALRAFVAQGHTMTSGVFRSHVARLVEYLESLGGLSAQDQERVREAIQTARK